MDTVTENLHVAEIASTQDKQPMEPPSHDAPEHIKARYWRDEIVKMTKGEVAELTGFSVSTITDMEAGHNRTTKKTIDPDAMRRYRMACAAVTLGVQFDWISVSLIPEVPVEIKLFGVK